LCAQETQKTEENERGVDLNINIYYGGRGIIDDPTIYVINKMQEVLEELRVHVERYNLYDGKTNITTLPQTLKEADGNDSGVVRYRWLYAAVSGCLLAVWG
jgi:hypothetical protein